MKLITDITLELTGEEQLYMVSAKQGDKKTRYVRVLLTNNGKEFIVPDGMIAIANIKKPDRKFCYNECNIEDNRIIIELTNQALAAAGTGHCDVEIRDKDNEVVLSTQAFTIEIEESMRNEDAIKSSNEMTALETKVQEYIDEMIKTKTIMESVEDAVRIAEDARKAAETERKKAEATRITQENSRVESEKNRQQQYNLMKEATTAANTAAQTASEQAEKIEVAEAKREENERNRSTAETTRQQQLELMQQATAASNAAAQEAQKQAETAKTATEKAEELYKTESEINKMYEQMLEIKGTIGSCIDGGNPRSIDTICCDGGTPFTAEDCEADAGNI